MINIISLPEIVSAISQHLNRNDLRNCVRVHSLWFDRFTPHLWRTIQCTLIPDLDPEPHVPEEEEEQAFIKNNRYIRTLRTNNHPLAKTALEHCTHLRHIHIPFYRRTPFTSARFVRESIAPAMKKNPKLETLVYKLFPLPPMLYGGALPLFKLMLEPLRSLTHLYITFETGIDQEAFMYLVRFAKQLHRFKLGVGCVVDGGNPLTRSDVEVEPEQTQLRQLEINGSMRGRELEFLIPLIKASPNLEKLALFYSFRRMAAPVAQTIRQNCPRLCHLILDGSFKYFPDDEIANLIDSCRTRGLQTFELPEPNGFHELPLQALCGHSATLESVHIPNHRGGISEVVQRLLTQCPNLRVLDTSSKWYDSQQLGQTPVRGLLEEPWVCTKLEVFRVVLGGVFGKGHGTANIVHYDYHQGLYTQLSRLTRLEELNVGYSHWVGAVYESAPQFSLESGLEMLEGLKQLKILDVSYTRNEIQRQELEWMCEHWPKLERIEGVRMARAALWWGSPDNSLAGDETSMPAR
ncbi:hypothetical protein BGX26_000688, partial [Mortierella sp. AD094]